MLMGLHVTKRILKPAVFAMYISLGAPLALTPRHEDVGLF
jgi:hypothetical protein